MRDRRPTDVAPFLEMGRPGPRCRLVRQDVVRSRRSGARRVGVRAKGRAEQLRGTPPAALATHWRSFAVGPHVPHRTPAARGPVRPVGQWKPMISGRPRGLDHPEGIQRRQRLHPHHHAGGERVPRSRRVRRPGRLPRRARVHDRRHDVDVVPNGGLTRRRLIRADGHPVRALGHDYAGRNGMSPGRTSAWPGCA
jgi:hypothetical protein